MAQLRTTTKGGLMKYVAAALNMFDHSMDTKELMQWNTKKVYIRKNKTNEKVLKEFTKLASTNEAEAYALELECDPGKVMCTIGSFEKPTAGKMGNRGDIAEGIIGAAITARFINKNEPISVPDIKAVLTQLKGAGTVRDQNFKSMNENGFVFDKVRFYLSLADINMKALLDHRQWAALEDLFKSAQQYANGATVMAWSKLLYENNQENYIEVISDGLSNQTGTKVDVKVRVDNQPTDINISLKAGAVKQFGQISGSEFSKQIKLHDQLFGIKVTHLEEKYNKLLGAKKPQEALYLVYNYVAQQINLQVRTKRSKDKILKNLGEGINDFATLGEENVTLVQLDKNEAKIYNFSGVIEAVSGLDISCTIKDSAGKPKLLLHDAKGRNLLEIRVKQENKPDGSFYFRNYVEKGDLLGKLIAIYA